MANLFGIDIAGIVAQEIGPGLLPATLIQVRNGVRTPGNLTGGTNPTENNIGGRGVISDYADSQINGTLIKKGDRQVLLIANTFPGKPVPVPDDKVIIENLTYNIVAVKRDPAAATYKCQVRK